MKHLLTYQEFLSYVCGIDPESYTPPEEGVSAQVACGQLRSRGADATVERLKNIVRNGHVESHGRGIKSSWTQDRIEAAARYIDRMADTPGGHTWLSPLSCLLAEHGFNLKDYYEGIRHAHSGAIEHFGERIACHVLTSRPNPSRMTMHLTPAYADEPASLYFALTESAFQEMNEMRKAGKASRRKSAGKTR